MSPIPARAAATIGCSISSLTAGTSATARLQHALGEAYRGLLLTGRYPIAFFTLHMPPELVDVNVHPTKLEVRFQDSGRLYSQLLSTLRSKFLTTDLNTRAKALSQSRRRAVRRRGSQRRSRRGPGPADAARVGRLGERQSGRLGRQSTGRASGTQRSDKPLARLIRRIRASAGARQLPIGTRWSRPLSVHHGTAGQASSGTPTGLENVNGTAGQAPGTNPRLVVTHASSALQIHNRYLVTETDEGVIVIDQHALHERILYEQLRHRVNTNAMETQNLLVPEPVDLSAAEAAAALENRDLLAELGMKIEPFGGDTVLVVGYPAMLANINPVELLRELLDRLTSGGRQPDRRDLLDDLLHTIACKAAIKAGDRLKPEEIAALLEQRHLVDDAHHCPHGRPAALVFTREELDRQFKRI